MKKISESILLRDNGTAEFSCDRDTFLETILVFVEDGRKDQALGFAAEACYSKKLEEDGFEYDELQFAYVLIKDGVKVTMPCANDTIQIIRALIYGEPIIGKWEKC